MLNENSKACDSFSVKSTSRVGTKMTSLSDCHRVKFDEVLIGMEGRRTEFDLG